MSLIGKIAKLDSTLQRGLDNGFAAVFGGRVIPTELEQLLKDTAADEIVRTEDGGVDAPNVFVVRLSGKDFSNLSENAPLLPQDFSDRLTRFYRNQQWGAMGPLAVHLVRDESVRTGQLHCQAKFLAAPEPATWEPPLAPIAAAPAPAPVVAPPAPTPTVQEDPIAIDVAASHAHAPTEHFQAPHPGQPTPPPVTHGPTVTLLLQDGSSRTYLVHEGSNIIGRGSDVDLRLPDTGVSRRHAEIVWDGQDAVLVDLQSTNGTTVNDEPIENWLLADGDVITVGHSFIEVRITGA
ncbi:DUF2662 domain-containing protein [Corynebacterium sp. 13CS0277]|uniref:DUF3662 and FHA domain-containing protein n=1 Tax=Corynebacterium sp. 13CS0277 TaxID=2071994 RepID=UPI000D03BE6B|nr:DUF3662 and FHA domain-containing protein [Corynebacterium sp. 13CS0277]PRQ10443.1 DUF2662 domain-containing protein [Corynebacterium sp. 13CS0277]